VQGANTEKTHIRYCIATKEKGNTNNSKIIPVFVRGIGFLDVKVRG